MKFLKLLVIILLLFSCASGVYAAKKIIFPNSSSLHPAPQNISSGYTKTLNSQSGNGNVSQSVKSGTVNIAKNNLNIAGRQVFFTPVNIFWAIILAMSAFLAFLYFKPQKK